MDKFPLVSLVVSTVSLDLIRVFLEHHQYIIADDHFEIIVVADPDCVFEIEKECSVYIDRVRVYSTDVKGGPNEKRVLGLNHSRANSIMFLDDDSFIDVDHDRLFNRLYDTLKENPDSWLLFPAKFYGKGGRNSGLVATPVRFELWKPGTGIEWNQIFPRQQLLELLNENTKLFKHFCTGEKWKSGGALWLMFGLKINKIPQQICNVFSITHPAQKDGNSSRGRKKFRNYRFGLGAVIGFYWKKLPVSSRSIWFLRLMLGAPLKGLLTLFMGDFGIGVARLFVPFDVARGFFAQRKSSKNYEKT